MIRWVCAFATVMFASVLERECVWGNETTTLQGPLLTVQSASLHRFQSTLRELQLPDPLAAAGLDTANTLEVIQSAVDLDAPMGGLIYLTEERPFLIVCLPVQDFDSFVAALGAFNGSQAEEESNKIYKVGKESPLFFKQVPGHILLGDHRIMLEKAVQEWNSEIWKGVSQDLKVEARLTALSGFQKQLVLKELMSLLAPPPSTGHVGMEAVADQLQFGVRLVMCQMLLDARGFELSLNRGSQGDLAIDIKTSESQDRTPPPSLFGSTTTQTSQTGQKGLGALQISSRLSSPLIKSVRDWVAQAAQDLQQAVAREELEDRSDMAVVDQALQWMQLMVSMSIEQQIFDGHFHLGDKNTLDGVAEVRVSNGSMLADKLRPVMASLRQKGLVFQEVAASDGELLHYAFEVPPELFSEESTPQQRQLHLRINAQRLALVFGSDGGGLLKASDKTAPTAFSTLAHCNLDAHPALVKFLGLDRILPFGYRKMSMEIKSAEEGRWLHAEFSHRSAPTSEPANAQAAIP